MTRKRRRTRSGKNSHREAEAQPIAADAGDFTFKAQIAELDERINKLEMRVVEAAKTTDTAEQLKSQIEELKAQSESGRIEF